jgi:hypothetical protein
MPDVRWRGKRAMVGSHDFFTKRSQLWRKTHRKWHYFPAERPIVPILDQVKRRCFVHIEQVAVTHRVDVIGRELMSCDAQRKKISLVEDLRIIERSERLPLALKSL